MQLLIYLLPYIKDYWKQIAVVFLVALLGLFIYNKGAQSVQKKWDASIAEAKDRARIIEQDNVILSNIIGGEYETGVKTIDDNFNAAIAGLRERASGDMPSTSDATCKFDEPTKRNAIYQENKRARLTLAREAEINTQRLISLQKWVKESK